MIHLSRIACFVILMAIALVTLCPIDYRPETGHPTLERFAAYLILGVALGIGFPRRLLYSCAFVIGVAVILEALQLVDPGRDARFEDLLVKATGGVIGALIPWFLAKVQRHATFGWRISP
jgi:VanZ family protein